MRRLLSSLQLPLVLTLLAAPWIAKADDAALLMEQPKADYQARRHDLMKKIQEAEGARPNATRASSIEPIVVIRGEDDRGKEDFEEGRFRQRNHFAYLTGVEIPGAYLVLMPNANQDILYLPPGGGNSVMNGDSTRASSAESLGFSKVESTDKLLSDIFGAIADPMRRDRSRTRSGVVYTLNPAPRADATDLQSRFVQFLKEGAPTTTFKNVAPLVDEMRKLKTPAEMTLLQKAIDITGQAQEDVMSSLKPDLFEFQMEAKVLGAFLNGGSMRPGFKSIVGSGPNSTIPHYFSSSRKMMDGDLVVVDIGAEYQLYTADITRTYPVNGKFTPRQREVYQLVLDAQSEAAKQMKPGETRLLQMTSFVSSYMRKSPLRAKDMNGQEHTMDHFFIHGLSHYLGMDVHDVGDGMKPMQVGEVFTIEPGIYIKSENLGIRIEDDYVMTSSGPEKMSKHIVSDPDEIELRIAKAKKN